MKQLILIAWTLLLSSVVAHAAAEKAAPEKAVQGKTMQEKTVAAKPACGPDALGTSRTLVVGTKGGTAVGLETYPRTLPLADHEVVLSFDDGPASGTTPAVLDALAHECVRTTFFLIGRNAEAQPELVARELAEGHTVGHHTFSHPARTLRRMSFEAAKADIDRGFASDDLAAYGSAEGAPRVPFFRFPGFADTKDLDDWLAGRNIAVFGTDLWAFDWLEESPQAELGILMRRLDKAKKGIILLHDTRPSTARMVPDLLRALKAGGYKVVHIVPGPGTVETTAAPKGWTSKTDKVIAEVFEREAEAQSRPRARHAGWHVGRYGFMRRWAPGRWAHRGRMSFAHRVHVSPYRRHWRW